MTSFTEKASIAIPAKSGLNRIPQALRCREAHQASLTSGSPSRPRNLARPSALQPWCLRDHPRQGGTITLAGWGGVKVHFSPLLPRPVGIPLPLHRKNFPLPGTFLGYRHLPPYSLRARSTLPGPKTSQAGEGCMRHPSYSRLMLPDAPRTALASPAPSRQAHKATIWGHVYSQIKLAARGWLNVRFSADCGRTDGVIGRRVCG